MRRSLAFVVAVAVWGGDVVAAVTPGRRDRKVK